MRLFCQNSVIASPARCCTPTASAGSDLHGQRTSGSIDPKPIGDVLGIKVFLADDHRLLVAGFRDVLKDYGIDVVEVAYSLDGLIDRFLEVKPDVLVIDVRFDSKAVARTGWMCARNYWPATLGQNHCL
jgi:hypothetical protein